MKTTALILALALVPLAAPAETPDYSRESLLRLFADAPEREDPEAQIQYDIGTISFRALGSRWKIAYLPFLMPLAGSRLTTNKDWADPFLLTGTQYASPPRTWSRSREMNAELRGIEKRLRKSAKVTVTVRPE